MAIEIFLNKSEYNADEEIEATIALNLDKVVKARGIFATLMCMEKKKVKHTVHIPRSEIEERKRLGLYTEVPFTQTETVEDHIVYREEKKVAGESDYLKAEFKVKFALPPDAAPTSHEFGHDNRINVWKLYVKLDIPFALDIHATHEIFVRGL